MDLKLEPLDSEIRADQPANFEQKLREIKYLVLETPHGTRRLCQDRRVILRFKPEKDDRRTNIDQHVGNGKWHNTYNL